ncbi:carbohydrate ABC transporter permease [Actinoplanes sp. NPDC089786]|uniref:carbohydrate ABC transporter permease n=1 Tax=Actinoplanes sp. NPDC089786 TaxID=3155185 RepID=UPI003425E117
MRNLTPGRVVRNVVVVALGLIWLLPTYLLIVNAAVSNDSYSGTARWFPGSFALWDNIEAGWQAADFTDAARNSLLYATVCAAAAVLIATLAAFALVVMPVRRKALWFWLIYAGTLLPLQVFARPLFLAASTTNLYDTPWGLGIVYVAICIPFAMFVVRNYLTTLPLEVTESARIDGAGWLRLFWSIHVPLSRSAMAAAFVFQFVYIWNELFFGITLSLSPEVQPVMAALAGLQGNFSAVGQPAVLAAALVVSLPTVALFFGFQRFFVTSLKSNI